MSNKISISDEQVRRIAKRQKQDDINDIQKFQRDSISIIRQELPAAHIRITGLEELASKPLEEYEKDIRKHFSSLFSNLERN